MSLKPKQLIRQNLKLVQPHKKTQNANVLGFLRFTNAFIDLCNVPEQRVINNVITYQQGNFQHYC